ncbi:MAG: GNAT family N-acetyltransferase [Bacilli bacterium]|nr:GNAT family N-acetyltransferase [Bacilli bacterium]
MEIVNVKNFKNILEEYAELCTKEWGTYKTNEELKQKVENKVNRILSNDSNVISILELIENHVLIGFISLFKTDGEERQDLTPWYATMYVKEEFRGKHYSKMLNDALLKEAKILGYNKVYLKTDLVQYYEKFGAQYLEQLKNGEKLYFMQL